MKHHILLIDDDARVLESTKAFLESEGFAVKAVASPDEGIALVRQKTIPFSLGLVDFHMPGIKGPEVIKQIRQYDPGLTVLGFSGDDSDDVHNKSLESGASFLVLKDTSNAKFLGILHRTCQDVERKIKPLKIIDESANKKLIASVWMAGVSNPMADVANLIHRFAPTNECVFIRGENGTGKELIAQAIHKLSPRNKGPFIAVNCAAIPQGLIEAELFGNLKGAFTGADYARKGKFEAAIGGTIFLDEIGDMPFQSQAALLRVLQEKTITPLGSNENKKLDVRVIAATNANLEKKIANEEFRRDLFERLNVLPIYVAPLRERPEDIPLLAEAFLAEANHDNNTTKILLQSTVDDFKRLPWPGNVRDLKNVITRMVLLSPKPILDPEVLKSKDTTPAQLPKAREHVEIRSNIENYERKMIIEALLKSRNISEGGRKLGMNRSTLRSKMKKYGIEIALIERKQELDKNEK